MNLIPHSHTFFYSSVKFNETLFYYLFTKPPFLSSLVNVMRNDVEKFKYVILYFSKRSYDTIFSLSDLCRIPVILLFSHYVLVIANFCYVQYQTYYFMFPSASGAEPVISSQVQKQKQCSDWLHIFKKVILASVTIFDTGN